MRSRHTLTLFTVSAILFFPLFAHSQAAKFTSLKWGTSSVGGSVYVMSVGMADLIQRKVGINVSVEAVGGSDANVRAFARKKIDISMLSAWSGVNAYFGIRQFQKEGKTPLRLLLQGQDAISNVIVRNDSHINTPADLKGKKFVGLRPASTDLGVFTYAMLNAYNIPKDQVKVVQTAETKESLEALSIGTVDGAIIQGGVGASNIMEIFQTTNVSLLPIADDKLDMILKELGPALHKATVPANSYKGQTKAVSFPAKTQTITVMADFPDDLAYRITKTLLENPQELARMHSAGKEWDLKTTLTAPGFPFHNGAVKYFKEKGYWTPALESQQSKLLGAK